MPVTVIVRSASGKGEPAPSLTFDGGRVVIGRGPGTDVRLPDPSVSVRHATIRASGSDWAVVDEGSTNGTWVGGVRLTPQSPRLVKSGDLVRIGRVWLELEIGVRAPTPDLGLATRELAFALVARAMDADGEDTVTRVRVVEGPDFGAELRLTEDGKAYLVGRGDRCDLPLADEDASREHIEIVRRGGQVFVRDLGSHNGAWLGESRLGTTRDTAWKAPTMMRVGQSVLALDEPVGFALAELEAVPDEQMDQADAPPEPEPSVAPPPVPTPRGQSDEKKAASPIAEIAASAPPAEPAAPAEAAPARSRGWTLTDVLVVTLAVSVIGASIAGLVWVLR